MALSQDESAIDEKSFTRPVGSLMITSRTRKAPVGLERPSGIASLPRAGFLHRHFGKWIALAHCGFPFAIGHYSTPVGRFRALARRSLFTRWGMPVRATTGVMMMLAWPFGAFSAALQNHSQMWVRGKAGGVRMLLDMYWLALRHSIPPVEYVLYRLDQPERREDMHEYVFWNDLPGFAALNIRLGADNRDVQDKDRFARICAEHGLPHVAMLAVFDRGKQTYPETPFAPDAPVIWAKSLRLKGGAGAAKWTKDGGTYRNGAGQRVPVEKLAEEFCKQDCIVQPYIENHPDIARISNGALASLRIVTGMNLQGHAEFVTTLLALPHGDWVTSAGGILCCIDYESGQIRRAVFMDDEDIASHPDTGAPIVGLALPYWRESVDLCLRAHARAFPRFAFLGLDVALTEGGPILLETNSGWGALAHQKLEGPLGHTAFSRLVAQYV
jgi:hypothetical protein